MVLLRLRTPCSLWLLGTRDVRSARRLCPIARAPRSSSHAAIWDPGSGALVSGAQLAMPFGSVAAVYAWARAGAAFQAILQHGPWLLVPRYVDDLILAELIRIAARARAFLLEVAGVLQFPLDLPKIPDPWTIWAWRSLCPLSLPSLQSFSSARTPRSPTTGVKS